MKISSTQYAKTLLSITEGKQGSDLDQVVKDFVSVLADRHELSRWREILRAFDFAWKKKYGTANIRLETAHTVSEAFLNSIQKAFPDATVTSEVVPELIGGAILQIDDRRIDGSVAGQLQRLEQRLASS